MTEHRGNQKCMYPVLAEREHDMIPAVGGFNTEDNFVITADGYERFTHVPKTLVCNS